MTDDGVITNKMLLEHIQAGDNALNQQLTDLKKEIQQGFQRADLRVGRLEEKMNWEFTEARIHRKAIQEDLDATITMQYKHEKELAVLTGRPLPEDY